MLGITSANLYFFTNLKGNLLGRPAEGTVNVFLVFNSILLILSALVLALGVILTLPTPVSRLQHTVTTMPLGPGGYLLT
jgi:hypothetical protein